MVAPRLSAVAVHSLLHDGPVAVVGHDKAVQVEVEPILPRRTVDLGDEPARRRQWRAIKADPRANVLEPMLGPPRIGLRGRRIHGCRARPRAARDHVSARRQRSS
jgi:hypothetical protein